MDSGRIALLEKAREFGSLAQNMTFQDFLDKSVTYRTLALYLGIQSEWWSEFWRSFSFDRKRKNDNQNSFEHTKTNDKNVRSFHFCCKVGDAKFALFYLSLWFGTETNISDIPKEEFQKVYYRVMRA